MSLEEIMEIVREEDFDVTLSGGDPLCSPDSLISLIDALKADNRNIWLFTGFTWETIMENPQLRDIVSKVDVVVDGPFIESRKDPDLLFRGSSNQRLIMTAPSLTSPTLILYPEH